MAGMQQPQSGVGAAGPSGTLRQPNSAACETTSDSNACVGSHGHIPGGSGLEAHPGQQCLLLCGLLCSAAAGRGAIIVVVGSCVGGSRKVATTPALHICRLPESVYGDREESFGQHFCFCAPQQQAASTSARPARHLDWSWTCCFTRTGHQARTCRLRPGRQVPLERAARR